jgi:MarR family 2-MHQ and catechol resistance regulon transcriptional repressor
MSEAARTVVPGVRVWLILWRATNAMRARVVKSIDSLQMCLSDFAVLEVLLHCGPLAVNMIGKKVLLTSGSITVAVDRLEQRGLVVRAPDPSDKRVTLVHLTSSGKKLIEEAFCEHARQLEELVSCLTDEERAELTRLLKKLGLNAERQNGYGLVRQSVGEELPG